MSSSDATLLIRVLEELNSSSDVTYTCFRLPRVESSKGEIYFAKLGSQTHAEQYHGEAESLRLMYNACPGICPRLIASGTLSPDAGGRPYVISEYKDLRSLNTKSSIILAQKLAEMHTNSSMYSHGRFGFEVPTYCGVTRINNGWYGTWAEAYSAMTGVLLDGLEHSEPSVVKQGRVIQEKVIPSLLDPEKLAVEPMLLHGDLWSGNVGTGSTGNPIIFDPASYYGHNEADLSIARIFGGFDQIFYDTYHQNIPKSDPVEEYEMRATLYELFHYLNHLLIFGGGYRSQCVMRMKKLLGSE